MSASYQGRFSGRCLNPTQFFSGLLSSGRMGEGGGLEWGEEEFVLIFVFVFVFELGCGSWGSKERGNTTQVKKTKVLGEGGGSDLEERKRGNK